MQELVSKLMLKDQKKRPSTAEILKMDYVRSRMQQFIEDAEFNLQASTPIYKKQRPTIRRAATKEVLEPGSQAPQFTP